MSRDRKGCGNASVYYRAVCSKRKIARVEQCHGENCKPHLRPAFKMTSKSTAMLSSGHASANAMSFASFVHHLRCSACIVLSYHHHVAFRDVPSLVQVIKTELVITADDLVGEHVIWDCF